MALRQAVATTTNSSYLLCNFVVYEPVVDLELWDAEDGRSAATLWPPLADAASFDSFASNDVRLSMEQSDVETSLQ